MSNPNGFNQLMMVLTQSATGHTMDWLQLTATACETTRNQSQVVLVRLRSKWDSKKCSLIWLPFVTGYKTGPDWTLKLYL